jgi:hypothetical protein
MGRHPRAFPRVQWVAASPVIYMGRLDTTLEPFLEHNWYYLFLPNRPTKYGSHDYHSYCLEVDRY